MTPKQRDILRHALGLNRRNDHEYRNHFVTYPGSDDYADCEALVDAGMMTKSAGSDLSGGDPVYRVTDARSGRSKGKDMSDEEQKCSSCGFPLSEYNAGLRHFGTHTAHAEWYCTQRMRQEIERLRIVATIVDGFTGPAPSPLEWRLICEKAAQVREALARGKT